jgi:hypothetical protein
LLLFTEEVEEGEEEGEQEEETDGSELRAKRAMSLVSRWKRLGSKETKWASRYCRIRRAGGGGGRAETGAGG